MKTFFIGVTHFPLNYGRKWRILRRLEEHNRHQKPTGCPSCHQESGVLPPIQMQQLLKTLCEDTIWYRQSLKHYKANMCNYGYSGLPQVLGIQVGLHARNPKPARPPWDQTTLSLKSSKKYESWDPLSKNKWWNFVESLALLRRRTPTAEG